MESSATAAEGAAAKASGFLKRLPADWVVTASRTSIFRLFYQMVLPYLSIYTIGLGANGTTLGLVNAAGLLAAALLSPYTGALMDRAGPKRIYLAGIGLLGASWLAYGFARSWPIVVAAMIAYYVGNRTSMHSCAGICASCLSKADRATAMSVCETLAAGILGIVGPLVGAFVVTRSGGMTVAGIRPLFFICFAGTALSFLLVRAKLSDARWASAPASRGRFPRDLPEVLRHGRHLTRFVFISLITQLPQGMIIPFTQPFAASRGAKAMVLGAMVTGFAVTPLALGIPAGRLADRIGRKKVLYLVSPLFWLSCLLLVFARSDAAFIAAGVLQGAYSMSAVVTAALQFELVEPGYLGRYLGVLGFFQMLSQALVALLSGFIWDRVGPQYVFLLPIALDLLVRMPLLAGIDEEPRGAAAAGA